MRNYAKRGMLEEEALSWLLAGEGGGQCWWS